MLLTYELRVWLSGEGGTWSNSYRFADRPEVATIGYLLEENREIFHDLYQGQVEECTLDLEYLEKRDREEVRSHVSA